MAQQEKLYWFNFRKKRERRQDARDNHRESYRRNLHLANEQWLQEKFKFAAISFEMALFQYERLFPKPKFDNVKWMHDLESNIDKCNRYERKEVETVKM